MVYHNNYRNLLRMSASGLHELREYLKRLEQQELCKTVVRVQSALVDSPYSDNTWSPDTHTLKINMMTDDQKYIYCVQFVSCREFDMKSTEGDSEQNSPDVLIVYGDDQNVPNMIMFKKVLNSPEYANLTIRLVRAMTRNDSQCATWVPNVLTNGRLNNTMYEYIQCMAGTDVAMLHERTMYCCKTCATTRNVPCDGPMNTVEELDSFNQWINNIA